MARGHALAVEDEYGFWILEPHLDGGLDRVVPAAHKVVHLFLRQRSLAFVSHLRTVAAKIKLHHVAVFGELDAVAIGPGVILPKVGRAGVGYAMVEGGQMTLAHLVFEVEPGLPAKGLNHRIEGRACLARVLQAGIVGRLGPQVKRRG
jgi:hypothetical protein